MTINGALTFARKRFTKGKEFNLVKSGQFEDNELYSPKVRENTKESKTRASNVVPDR